MPASGAEFDLRAGGASAVNAQSFCAVMRIVACLDESLKDFGDRGRGHEQFKTGDGADIIAEDGDR